MKNHYDYIVVGAGPAGLQLGYYFQKNNLDYVILEGGEAPGVSFKKYPRHGTLISINKVYSGYDDEEICLRWDWNSLLCEEEGFSFRQYSKSYFPDAKDLVRYFNDYAEKFNLNIKTNQKVEVINKQKNDEGQEVFKLDTPDGQSYSCNKLIIATGMGEPYVPDIPGIELAVNYADVSVNKKDFENQRVLVIGKGNSGFETADHLIDTTSLIHICSPNSVRFAWQTHYVGDLRAINNNFLDTYQLKSQNAVLDAEIVSIKKSGDKYLVEFSYSHASNEEEVLEYDSVIVCTGFKLDRSIFGKGCMPEMVVDKRFPALNADWGSCNIDGLYFAGVLMQSNFYRKTTSGFIHGFRYNVKTLFHILHAKYHQKSLPVKKLGAGSKPVAEEILNRINRSSALWQQFGYLSDFIEVGNEGSNYYYELPKDYFDDAPYDRMFTIALEFGESQENVFSINRNPTAEKAQESFFLHPVIRHYHKGKLVSCLHLVEDLFGEWKHEEKHIKVLEKYVEKELSDLYEEVNTY